jgi:hypothetical protein
MNSEELRIEMHKLISTPGFFVFQPVQAWTLVKNYLNTLSSPLKTHFIERAFSELSVFLLDDLTGKKPLTHELRYYYKFMNVQLSLYDALR